MFMRWWRASNLPECRNSLQFYMANFLKGVCAWTRMIMRGWRAKRSSVSIFAAFQTGFIRGPDARSSAHSCAWHAHGTLPTCYTRCTQIPAGDFSTRAMRVGAQLLVRWTRTTDLVVWILEILVKLAFGPVTWRKGIGCY